MRLLIVEDDVKTARALAAGLSPTTRLPAAGTS